MFALDLRGIEIETFEIDAIDDVLRRQFDKANRIRTAMPMEMHCPAAPRIEPFGDRARQCGTVGLVEFREPDEHVSLEEDLPKRGELFLGIRNRILGKNRAEDVRARRSDQLLERRDDGRENTRIQF